MMLAVAVLATTLAIYRAVMHEVSKEEIIRIATDALQTSNRSFSSDGVTARAYKTCGQAPWTVEFSSNSSRYLNGLVIVSDAGHVGRVMAFNESGRVVGNSRLEDLPAVPIGPRN
jgi:hypothetical protein